MKPDESKMREYARRAFKFMIEARTADLKFSSLYKAGKITGGCHIGKGQEAVAASSALFLQRHYDVYSPFIREQAGRLAFGEPLIDSARTYLGSVNGPMRGRDGNVHRGDPEAGLIVPISHLGATISVVNGCLLAKRLQGKLPGPVGLSHIGDGTTSTGSFHEALNMAAVESLPLILVVTNNQFAYSTPNTREFACENLSDKAIGYGVRGYKADGTDLIAMLELMHEVVHEGREGHGPALVVPSLLRLCGHGEHDDAKYIPDEMKNSHIGRDCNVVAEAQLLEREWITPEEIEEWRHEASEKVQTAVAQAQREAEPDPYRENWDTTYYHFEYNY